MLRLLCGLAGLLWLPWVAAAQLHHALEVVLLPEAHRLEVQDTITLPEGTEGPLHFTLHPGLQPELLTPDARLSELPAADAQPGAAGITPRHYRVELSPGQRRATSARKRALISWMISSSRGSIWRKRRTVRKSGIQASRMSPTAWQSPRFSPI